MTRDDFRREYMADPSALMDDDPDVFRAILILDMLVVRREHYRYYPGAESKYLGHMPLWLPSGRVKRWPIQELREERPVAISDRTLIAVWDGHRTTCWACAPKPAVLHEFTKLTAAVKLGLPSDDVRTVRVSLAEREHGLPRVSVWKDFPWYTWPDIPRVAVVERCALD